jgi:hypothetical protein
MSQSAWNEERLAVLLGRLRPAPRGWVEAASTLPRLRTVLDDLAERAEADAAFRDALVADLEAALQSEGVEPTRRAVSELRTRLG